MQKGILRNNRIYCPICNQCNYQLTNDYKLVTVEGKNYTEFVARCLTDNCNDKFYYQSLITMDETIHCIFDRSKETVVKEED